MSQTDLIPRETLFGNPQRLTPEVSPDGQWLAYIAPDARNVLQVWVRDLRASVSGPDRMITADPQRGIRSYFWTYQPGLLVYLQDQAGDENFHLFAVEIRSGQVRDLTPFKGVRANLVAVEPRTPGQLLVAMNRLDPRKHDVYRLPLDGGQSALDTKNPGNVIAWTSDADLQIRAALAALPDGGHELWIRPTAQAPWETVIEWGPDDEGGPVDFSADGQTLFIVGNHGANAQRLIAFDLTHRTQRVVAEDPEYDVGGVLVHPRERKIQAVSFYRDRLVWQVLDSEVAQDFKVLEHVRKGEVHIHRGDLNDQRWVVSYVTDDGPVYYYLYDRASRQASLLFSQRPALESIPLRSIEPITLTARDGLRLHGYLTLPSGGEKGANPTVVLVHGGPWARDRWGFNPMVQWLANRGYAVLQINYRGSTGYGKNFLNAGNREWAGKMHDDLIDGVKWLLAKGLADAKRVAIMGGSYGGYATLVGLTFTPEVFAAGVDIVGPSNIITLIQTIPPYWEPMKATFARRLGVVDRDEAFMKSRSPVFFVDRIRAPLLIGQGAHDPRVKQSESDQMVAAIRKNGKSVQYWVYADEGHGFARPQNRNHFYGVVETFLAKHLGGRAEPEVSVPGHSGEER